MITDKASTHARNEIDPYPAHHPSSAASLAWLVTLAIAVVGGSFTLACITPFAALAVALAGTVRLRAALSAMTAVWLTNQVIGFAFLGFPPTTNTFAWGLAIGAAALVSTVIAFTVLKGASSWTVAARLAVALLLAFAGYEVVLFAIALFLGGVETFAPAIVAQLAFSNIVWFVVIIALNEVAAVFSRPWLGATPRLVRAS